MAQSTGNKRVFLSVLAALVLFQGCASAPPRNNPLPEDLADAAAVPGIPNARTWGDEAPKRINHWLNAPQEELEAAFGGVMNREHYYLAISGGGDNGAFGAGLLNGWTESGTRPEFTMVTGISAGGLIAPFAFLGPAYDPQLQAMFTSYSTEDLVAERRPIDIVRNDALADFSPMRAKIAEYVDEDMMREIAAQFRRGRLLFIGTTHLDAARPVMWNIGEIANSDTPGALDLIRDIMHASASIPGAFPPVPIEVEVDGKRYEELHVDGGVTSQVFLYPIGLDWRLVEQMLNVQGRPQLYVIRNAFLEAEWKTVERKIAPILAQTITSLIRTQGIGDLFRLYLGSVRDGLGFRLAFIPADVEYTAQEPFDREYMSGLYERARAMATEGYPWASDPYHLETEPGSWRPDQ
jgi:Patatin-like phospholipase